MLNNLKGWFYLGLLQIYERLGNEEFEVNKVHILSDAYNAKYMYFIYLVWRLYSDKYRY